MLPQELRAMTFEEEVIDLEGVRPIRAEKIVYYQDPLFMERVRTPPTITPLDLTLHRARVETRFRPFSTEDVDSRGLVAVAADMAALPTLKLDASESDIASFVDRVLERLAGTEDTRSADEPALAA
jgi:type IV secretion system protein VirD4